MTNYIRYDVKKANSKQAKQGLIYPRNQYKNPNIHKGILFS